MNFLFISKVKQNEKFYICIFLSFSSLLDILKLYIKQGESEVYGKVGFDECGSDYVY